MVGSLSPTSICQRLNRAKQQYNTVLIDSGPVPASNEASLVASQADGVILTIPQGGQGRAAEGAFRHLMSVGANITGLVFKRAKPRDTQYESSSSGLSRPSSSAYLPRARIMEKGERDAPITRRFGLIGATAMCLPSTHSGAGQKNQSTQSVVSGSDDKS